MNAFVEFLWNIIKEWYTQIIAVIVGMIFMWIFGLLPPKFQYHKRLNFALKISNAISKIDISIETEKLTKIKDIHNSLKKFLNNTSIDDIKINEDLSFNSNKSGSAYKVYSYFDEGLDKNFILINSFNSFDIGFFGKLKGLRTTTNEIQSMLENLLGINKSENKITVHITITPRRKNNSKEKLQVKYDGENFSTTYNLKNIKIVNNGMSSIEENINKVFYDWMTSLL